MRHYSDFVLDLIEHRCFMKIGYARVSSTGQNETAQVDLLTRHGAEQVFVDKASGTSREGRDKLAEAIRYARKGDALVVTRLDRLARSVPDLHLIAQELQAKGVDLIVTEQNIDTSTSMGRLMFNMLGAIAEFETDLRKERQLEGIAKAKEEGRYKGRPVTVDGDAIRAALAAGDKPMAVAKRFNVARSTVYRMISDEPQSA
jgi:DNA invertase Pin-like site-specific DNA recombinase